ncbi:MAG: hypothetical protein LBJ94_03995 [Puniceicoccales bacterium]|jgi:hypothetical protein|nr:hypothetical protein [Puniceicoccales bacterium]
MHILVLVKSAIARFGKNERAWSLLLDHVYKNKYDKILLCDGGSPIFDGKLGDIAVERVNPIELFELLNSIVMEYKDLCLITLAHSNDQSIIENYLKSVGRLNMSFLNLSENKGHYENYAYTNVDMGTNYFSVKSRKYTSLTFDIYTFPLVNVQQTCIPTANPLFHEV